MKLKSIVFKILIFLVAFVASNVTASTIGEWLKSRYAFYSYGPFFWGPSNGEVIDGWILGYVIFSALLFPLYTQRIRSGFYWALPALLLLFLTGTINPQLWLSLLLLALGLGLAWLILKLKTRIVQKRDTNKNG